MTRFSAFFKRKKKRSGTLSHRGGGKICKGFSALLWEQKESHYCFSAILGGEAPGSGRRLVVKGCPQITTLDGICKLRGLEELNIRWCKNLLISAEEILPSKLQFVWFEYCEELTSIPGLQNLPSLKELKLYGCPKLELTLEEKLSTMPNVLEIIYCRRLEKWCQRHGYKYYSGGDQKSRCYPLPIIFYNIFFYCFG
ncbi:hypothetical protein M5K25_001034 [Dendrobium thyrsiflorum]|uniref:Uncharacterized protein n=1 Tax=Dendrobium thyrsiflorum TaxID=117978 RepID=A0ABD0VV07_DENTH